MGTQVRKRTLVLLISVLSILVIQSTSSCMAFRNDQLEGDIIASTNSSSSFFSPIKSRTFSRILGSGGIAVQGGDAVQPPRSGVLPDTVSSSTPTKLADNQAFADIPYSYRYVMCRNVDSNHNPSGLTPSFVTSDAVAWENVKWYTDAGDHSLAMKWFYRTGDASWTYYTQGTWSGNLTAGIWLWSGRIYVSGYWPASNSHAWKAEFYDNGVLISRDYCEITSPNPGDSTMCKDVQNSYPWDPINRTSSFQRGVDTKACVWFRWDNMYYFYEPSNTCHMIKYEWIDPSGSVVRTAYYYFPDYADSGYSYWLWGKTWDTLSISSSTPLGTWAVNIYMDEFLWDGNFPTWYRGFEGPMFTLTFTVTEQEEPISNVTYYYRNFTLLKWFGNQSLYIYDGAYIDPPTSTSPSQQVTKCMIKQIFDSYTIWIGSLGWVTKPLESSLHVKGDVTLNAWMSSTQDVGWYYWLIEGHHTGYMMTIAEIDENGKPTDWYQYAYFEGEWKQISSTPTLYSLTIKDVDHVFPEGHSIIFTAGILSTMQGWTATIYFDSTNMPSRAIVPEITKTGYTVTFYTDPSDKGSITFGGEEYTNGQYNRFAVGDYTVTANSPSGYMFDHWETSGGVSVGDQYNANTTVHVSTDGSLKAYFKLTDFNVSADPSSLNFTKPFLIRIQKVTITVTSLYGFSSPVTLSATWVGNSPKGIRYIFAATLITPPSGGQATTTLTVMTFHTASIGSYILSVIATSGSQSHYVDIAIVVS
jgi:hypothetical protein